MLLRGRSTLIIALVTRGHDVGASLNINEMKFISTLASSWPVRLAVLALAVLAVGFNIDPVRDMLGGQPHGVVLLVVALFTMAIGYFTLKYGGEEAVNNAVAFAHKHALSISVVGVILALGTALPESGLTIITMLGGHQEVAVGATVGSDGFSIGFIFFILSWFAVNRILHSEHLRQDLWALTAMTLAVLTAILFGFTRLSSAVILSFSALAIYLFMKDAKEGGDDEVKSMAGEKSASVFALVSGFAFLLLGTQWLVDGLLTVGTVLGLSNTVIGLFGAVANSMPELATLIPVVRKGRGLEFIILAICASNALDTGFLALAGLIKPFAVDVHVDVVLNAVVTFGVTALLLLFSYKYHSREVPRWWAGVAVAYTVFMVALPFIH